MKLYFNYFKMHLQSSMEHKMSFFLTMLAQLLVSFNSFLGLYFLFSRFHSVKGYTFYEILLLQGVVSMQFALAEWFVRGFDSFASIIGNGEFDRIMVRPRSLVLQVLGSRIEFSRAGKVVQGIVMLGFGIKKSGIVWTFDKVFLMIGMLISGIVIFGCIFLVYASICFFTTEGLEVVNLLTNGVQEHGKYPLDIFGKKIMIFCTFIIPYALSLYYPFLYLTGRAYNKIFLMLPVLACFVIVPSYWLWKFGVGHYKSTGS